MKSLGRAEFQLNRARKALRERRFPEAQSACHEALQKVPDCSDAYLLLGEIAWRQDALGPAVDLFQRARQFDRLNPSPLVWLARTFAQAYQFGPALDAAERAAELKPRDAASLHALGLVFARASDHARAVSLFVQAVATSPRNTTYLADLGVGQQIMGFSEDSIRTFQRCVEIDPGSFRAYAKLVELTKQTPDQNYIPVLERLLDQPSDDIDRKLTIGYALAKSYEDIGDPKAALTSLRRGKAARRQRVGYRYDQDRDLFAAATQIAPGSPIVGTPNPSDSPIFVVGMPRSGTTLTDRILASHPKVASVGEMQTFAILTHKLTGVPSPRALQAEAFRRAASIDVGLLGGGYLRELAAVAGRRRHYVDKLPFNFLFAGLIHWALPNARIVSLRRDPIDVCLSNYRIFFSSGSAFHDYAYDLCDIARYYVLFDKLMDHWSAVLPPDRFMSLQYEALVDHQEAETRRLLSFCGLDWDERCMAFHEHGAGLATPSTQQVRTPLFKTSIGRWRRYGDVLNPMIEILKEAGLVTPDAAAS